MKLTQKNKYQKNKYNQIIMKMISVTRFYIN